MKSEPGKPQKIDFTYSTNIVELLKRLHSTIVMSTYQSGKLMLMGAHAGNFELRYREFPRPMGMYADQGRLWAGLGHGIHQFANFSAVAQAMEEGNAYDACYLPQHIHYTGDIDIHEMAMCRDRLYFVNTKFSCLCVQDDKHSFRVLWKPPFVNLLQPLDKCHLNGFCARDGEPRYVTALGETDEALGWRANKADGGILMDIQTNQILARGLSMPHSPRWHQEKLWLLESGKGALSRYDFETGKVVEIASLPGFTRGLDFVGDFAFIGLSKVRESATFSGLPITRQPKRVSGVWVVNIKTGKIVSCIEFTAGLDEVFAVSVLPHSRMEMLTADSPQSHGNYLISSEDTALVKMPETLPERAIPHFERGLELSNENRKEEAIESYRQALAIQPDLLPATFNMAVALGDMGRFDEAEAVLQEVLEKDASILAAYDSMGYVHYKRGDHASAKACYEKILELDQTNKKALNSLEILAKSA